MEGYDRGWGDGGVISSGESLVAALSVLSENYVITKGVSCGWRGYGRRQSAGERRVAEHQEDAGKYMQESSTVVAGRVGIDAINTIFITIRQMQVEYFSSSTFYVRCWFLFPFVC
jgi:hypothetical protein